jgi:23S rRNA (pseudouridine1915-N3)-methyltransferase
MHIIVITVGKVRDRDTAALVDRFVGRLRHYCAITLDHVKEEKITANRSEQEVLRREGQRLAAKLKGARRIIVLDRKGRSYTSTAFAAFVNEQLVSATPSLHLVIGGALGLDDEVISGADFSLSLSSMTFPHEFSLVLLLEQLYRAYTILNGQQYHK